MNSPAISPLNAFTGRINPSPSSFLYTVGLGVTALMMAILPLIYLSLVGLAVYGTYWYATHAWSFLGMGSGTGSGRAMAGKMMIYITPLFTGGVLVLFMIKPLFAKAHERSQPYAVNPEAEPLLFGFVQKIAQLVGSPEPKRIALDCELNASASFRRGWRSMFGNDLVLTIGMPLVAGLTMQQLAGVIAHELGHFTQGMGMRLTYIIRSIDAWFARVIYERDEWDYTLEEWAQAEDGRVAIVVGIARLGVWFSRVILKVLMLTGHAVSCFMLRQMEYDADHYEIEVAGSKAFEDTVMKLQSLGVALGACYKEMRVGWTQSRKLPDNIPAYLMCKTKAVGTLIEEELKKTLPHAKTGVFDTHPSDADRVRCARRANKTGVFQLEKPATELFSNFGVPAKFVTLMHYRDDLNLELVQSQLAPTPEPYHEVSADEAAPPPVDYLAVAQDYFFGLLNRTRFLKVHPAERTGLHAAAEELRSLPARLNTVREQISTVTTELEKVEQSWAIAVQAEALIKSGVWIDPAQYGLENANESSAFRRVTQLAMERDRLLHKMDAVYEALETRVALMLALARNAERSEGTGNIWEIVAFLQGLEPHWPKLIELRTHALRLRALADVAARNGETAGFSDAWRAARESAQQMVAELEREFEGLVIPGPSPDAGLTLHQSSLDLSIPDSELQVVIQLERYWERAYATYWLIMGALAIECQRLEDDLANRVTAAPVAMVVQTGA